MNTRFFLEVDWLDKGLAQAINFLTISFRLNLLLCLHAAIWYLPYVLLSFLLFVKVRPWDWQFWKGDVPGILKIWDIRSISHALRILAKHNFLHLQCRERICLHQLLHIDLIFQQLRHKLVHWKHPRAHRVHRAHWINWVHWVHWIHGVYLIL